MFSCIIPSNTGLYNIQTYMRRGELLASLCLRALTLWVCLKFMKKFING